MAAIGILSSELQGLRDNGRDVRVDANIDEICRVTCQCIQHVVAASTTCD